MAPTMGTPVARRHFLAMLSPVWQPQLFTRAPLANNPWWICFSSSSCNHALETAVDLVAIVEHEARLVRMEEEVQIRDLHLVAGLSAIEIIDQRLGIVEPDQLGPVFRRRLGDP